MLDDLSRLDRHLVCQIGHGDRFSDVNFANDLLGRCGFNIPTLIPIATPTARTATASRTTPTRRTPWSPTGLQSLLFLGIFLPTA